MGQLRLLLLDHLLAMGELSIIRQSAKLTSQRTPYIIQVPFALYLLVAVQFVPETPRFLIGKGRDEEALQFFIDYHGNGDAQDPLVLFEYAEVKEAIRREKEAKAEKWSTILRSRPNRHRLGLAMLITFCTNVSLVCPPDCAVQADWAQMSGSSLIYFYCKSQSPKKRCAADMPDVIVFSSVGITDATTQTGIAAGLSMFTWVCQIAAVFASKRVGRKTMLLWVWPFILIFLSCLCATS